ncbi:MAG TPA: hypothetical protein PKN36_09035, partial [bacterium]|nr:hypothetical protein [bacterium]
KSVLRALWHFGVYGEAIDLARLRISSHELEDVHLLILAQEGIGKSLCKEETDIIIKSVSRGMGLLVLDGYLDWYPVSFLKDMRIFAGKKCEISSLKLNAGNDVADLFEKEIFLKQPLPGYAVSDFEGWSTLLADGEGSPSVIYRKCGKGKVVFFLLSAALWQKQYLGFGEGLDGVFRNSMAWAAKKPYIMKSMPPFITAKFDDVSFSGSRTMKQRDTLAGLGWLDTLNRYGFIPNIGVFIEDIQDEDAKRFREKERSGLAEFSPHAFVDFRYRDNEDECPIYLKHNGQEFTSQELKRNFARVDSKFEEWGINPAKTLNAHYQEIGLNSLPLIKERGQKYLMTPIRLGKAWSDPQAHSWDCPPYGKPGFSLGQMYEDNDFFNVLSIPPRKDVNVPTSDFLYGCTGLHGESSFNNVEKAIDRAVFQIKRGLETGFFGCFMTHEQRISQLSPEEWKKIIKGISDSVGRITHIMKSYDDISRYAENRTFYSIEDAFFRDELTVRLKGRSGMPQYLYLFVEENGNVKESFLKIPEFEKSIELNFRI